MWKISSKGTCLRESAFFEPSCVKNGRRVWPVDEFLKKSIKIILFIFHPYAQKPPPWTDMHLIWHSRSGRRRNHLWQIFWWSVEGCRFCGRSKIAISHWQSQLPLTQGWRYRAACKKSVKRLSCWNECFFRIIILLLALYWVFALNRECILR